MQLHRRKSSILLVSYLSCLAISLMCLSCNEKPKFKKKHYTDKRVVRNYKRSDALLATATTKETAKQEKNSIPHKPLAVKKPKPADKLNHSKKERKEKTAKPAKSSIKIIKKRQNKYYIIASSHSTEAKAIEMSQKYIKMGFPVEIITSKNKYRVTIRSEKSKQKAIKLRDSLRVKLNRKDFWLLRF